MRDKTYKCTKCNCELVFESKKSFSIPDIRNGICLKCGAEYKLVDGKLIKKGGDK